MERAARQWLAARNVIAKALHEWKSTFKGEEPSQQDNDRAAAIIARLAANDPPLLICEPDEIKEHDDGR